jgi:hypothetical protein
MSDCADRSAAERVVRVGFLVMVRRTCYRGFVRLGDSIFRYKVFLDGFCAAWGLGCV